MSKFTLTLKDIRDLKEAALKSEQDRSIIYIQLCDIIEEQNEALKYYAKITDLNSLSVVRRMAFQNVGKVAKENLLEDGYEEASKV